ncbi:hypothetical protein TTHERM_00284150 (macronuclear) [Tetrahymena thermophila SB210]|uniref:Uncharacterized protein n=1 Tax=Tetrahymena thermophila (strain SB210) TaxID=312017 RepID=I7M8G3_TETTS|nr:hypothetical protein TTHERM_00284150 [Tetrahymena thermophila SB210]EAR98025.1 hypothetical protein TTHERM_00284150 [Tetrahymena thermophila SB210]|eukprot:XP_001018270.1 hypothetical protein TTHERM_00284150 [Tetrahymena thermophila SB210]
MIKNNNFFKFLCQNQKLTSPFKDTLEIFCFKFQNQQGGEVESRWAHNSKVGGSKPLSAKIFIQQMSNKFAQLFYTFINIFQNIQISWLDFDSLLLYNQQGGEVESRWAHNSKVGGSKPLSAKFFLITKKQQNEKMWIRNCLIEQIILQEKNKLIAKINKKLEEKEEIYLVRNEFLSQNQVEDEGRIEYLIAIGRKQLPMVKQMINMSQ